MADYKVAALAAQPKGSREIELSWQPPADVIAAIKYRIKYAPTDAAVGGPKLREVGGDTTIIIGGLEPSTSYTFDVVVTTMLGMTSTEVATVVCHTGLGRPTAIPTAVTCEFTSSAFSLKKGGEYDVSVKVRWKPPSVKAGDVNGYVVHYAKVGKSSQGHTQAVDGGSSSECTVTGLESHTSYVFSVAVRNDVAEGPRSEEVVLQIAEQKDNARFEMGKRSSASAVTSLKQASPRFSHNSSAQASPPSKEKASQSQPVTKDSADEQWQEVESSARLASVRRQQEREEAEAWERKRTGTLDASPFVNKKPPAKKASSLSTDALQPDVIASSQSTPKMVLSPVQTSAATSTPNSAPTQAPRKGGAVAAARAAAAQAESAAEQAREEEKRQMEDWERKKLAAVRSTPKDSPTGTRRESAPQEMPPPKTRQPSKIIKRVTTSESDIGNTPPQAKPLQRRDSKIIAMATTSESEIESGSGPETLKRHEAEAKRQAEIDAAAAWDLKVGTVGRSSVQKEEKSMLALLSTLEVKKEGGASGADQTQAGSNVEAEPETQLRTVSLDELDAEARREAEKQQMESWESKIGKGGRVQDAKLGMDTLPQRVPLKSSGTSGSALSGLSLSDSRPRAGSMDSHLNLAGVDTPRSASTFAKTTSSPADHGRGIQRNSRAMSFGDITRTKNLSQKAGPVGKAMVEFMAATTMEDMLIAFERTRTLANVGRTGGPGFFDELKSKITSQLDYKRGHLLRVITQKMRKHASTPGIKSCEGLKVVVVGSGPVGLRQAIELTLLKAEVHVIEQRTVFSRYNILHLWDWVCHDLLELGVSNSEILGKSFYHIGTKELQLLLAKLALCMGIRISSGVKFQGLTKPRGAGSLWTVQVSTDKSGIAPNLPGVLEANVLIEAGGINCPVVEHLGFERKKVKMSTALGLVAHFAVSQSDRQMEEFSVSSQFKQQKFKEMREKGLHLENCVYYQGATHYYVMTPTAASLRNFGALKKVEKHPSDTVKSSNVDYAKLHEYARAVATSFGLPPSTPFIKDANSAQIFDFSSRSQCKVSCKVLEEKGGAQLLVLVVGDALIEPFWPEGLGLNRGFLSALDASYTIQEYFNTGHITKEASKKMLKSKEKLFNLMKVLSGHTKKEVLREDFRSYTLHPNSRYLKWKTGY